MAGLPGATIEVGRLRNERGLTRGGPERPITRSVSRKVWFHREYVRLYGGHVKHSHYFDHVLRMPGFAPRITFTGEPSNESLARERAQLWPAGNGVVAERWEPGPRDVLFLAGLDWRFLDGSGLGALPNPRINLIQHVRHAHAGTELHRYLAERAIRICVSQEVAGAVSATGRPRGPVLTIPNGIDVTPFEAADEGSPDGFEARPSAVTIVGYKRPDLARGLAARLHAEGVQHRLLTEFLDRGEFLELLAGSRVAVCLPHVEEGFYLPALEAMASGCLVVTLDGVGNRGFCRHEGSCLIAEPNPDSLRAGVTRALGMPAPERGRMHRHARDTAARHSLEAERERFHAILGDVDRLWRDTGLGVGAAWPRPCEPDQSGGTPPPARVEPEPHRPMLGFMIVGAQRCGTTALARFLSRHPGVAMSSPKEVHLFDGANYSSDWTSEQIDARYRRAFTEGADGRIRGEATPVYLFFPEIARELRRYHPGLKLIVLLRDPVGRALSSYYFQKRRGKERRPLWLALLLEPLRLRRRHNPRASGSLTRVCAYRRRGLYSLQLRNLYRSFDREQVLIVRTRDLEEHHDAVLRRVFAFLGVDEGVQIAPERVHEADRGGRKHRVVSWLLRLSYLAEYARMRALSRSLPVLTEDEGPAPLS